MGLANTGRILYISIVDVSQPDGPGVNEREFMVSLLHRFGRRVHVLIPRPREACSDVDTTRTTYYRNPGRWNPFGFLRQQWELKNKIWHLLAQQSFDLVVLRVGVLPLGFYLTRKMPVPYAVKTFGDYRGFEQKAGLKGLIGTSISRFNRFLVRHILAGALAIDTVTEILRKAHAKEFGLPTERLRVIENATNTRRFVAQDPTVARSATQIGNFHPVLGYVGGRPTERGGMQMLEVAARILDDYSRLGVVIVGKGDLERLRKRAQELGIEDHVVIPGQVPYEKIPSYVNSFDVCFALDRADRFRQIGNSDQKVRQYLACGKPVVTRATDDSFLVKENLAAIVEVDDLDAIERATRRFLDWDDPMRRQHAVRVISYVRERLSTEATLSRRIEFWSQRLSQRVSGSRTRGRISRRTRVLDTSGRQ